MDRGGIDVSVLSSILGWDTTLDNCRLLNDCTARAQKDFPAASPVWRMCRRSAAPMRSKNWNGRSSISVCKA